MTSIGKKPDRTLPIGKKPNTENRKATGLPEATDQRGKSPRRHLDPDLAQAIKEAKLKTGKSWRKLAKVTGLSHSYLVQLSNGQRVPSRATVEVLARWLPIEEAAVERLRKVMVVSRERDG